MNNSIKTLLLAAAGAGLMSGATTAQTTPASANGPTSVRLGAMNFGSVAEDPAPKEKHACKGQNTCAGKGGCKASMDGCKAKNNCKGRGGCKTDAAM